MLGTPIQQTLMGVPTNFIVEIQWGDELGSRPMVSVISRESYFETGLEVLADLGYGGLKLAEVCTRLGVTTGSFYHYFASWPAYTKDLVAYWLQGRTLQAVEAARAEADPRQRIATLIVVGLSLPHGAEAAIRVWSSVDAHVHEVQVAVDQQRFDILYESAFEILEDKRRAQLFASWGVYLLVGYEQATLPSDPGALEWIARQWLGSLDSGVYTSVSDGD
jgi:AcrR family transcriptional regulator